MSGLNELINKVHHSSAEDLLGRIPDDSIDLIVTSPPYDNLRAYKGFTWDFEYIARDSYRVLKPGGVLVWVVGDKTVDGSETFTGFRQALCFRDKVGFLAHDTMIYERGGVVYPDVNRYYQVFEYMFVFSKGKPKTANLQVQRNRYAGTSSYGNKTTREADSTLTDKGKRQVKEFGIMGNIWKFATGYGNSSSDPEAFEHPAIFPESLAERHILTWSNPGDIVLDYFGGSGTTAKMARNHNRQWITGDISAEYCELMERRLSLSFTLNMFDTIESEAQ